jgi:hypothetical protein
LAGRVRGLRRRNPLPSEPDGRRFDASGSSMKQRTTKHAVNPIGLEATCTLREQSRLPRCHGGGSRTSKDRYSPAVIAALLPNAGWLFSHVHPHQREVGSVSRGVMFQPLSAPLQRGFCLLPPPLPAVLSGHLTTPLAARRQQDNGLTTFRR